MSATVERGAGGRVGLLLRGVLRGSCSAACCFYSCSGGTTRGRGAVEGWRPPVGGVARQIDRRGSVARQIEGGAAAGVGEDWGMGMGRRRE